MEIKVCVTLRVIRNIAYIKLSYFRFMKMTKLFGSSDLCCVYFLNRNDYFNKFNLYLLKGMPVNRKPLVFIC